MRKSLMSVFIVISFLCSCNKEEIDPITNIALGSTQVIIGVGESISLSVKHTPENLTPPTYVWTSLSPNIATTDANGLIIGKSVGSTKITVTSKNNSKLSATCTIIVKMRGSADLPYLINSIHELKSIRDSINSGKLEFSNFTYKLMSDLDFLNENYWNPISNTQDLAFKGVFEGNGKKIRNIKIGTVNTKVSINCSGLFGYISGGKVLNLSIDWICLNTTGVAGGITGNSDNGTLIDNCHTSGIISGRYYSGGIVGISTDTEIKYSSSTRSTTTNANSSDTYDGGIVAKASDTRVNNCYSNGNLSAYNCGGIIGASSNGTTINDCYSTGSFSSLGGLYPAVGGIVGNGSNTIINHCYSIGTIKSNGGYGYAGGIVGDLTGNIYNCYSTGPVVSDLYSGGIAGYLNGIVYNCYSTGAINSSTEGYAYSGGICGVMVGSICNCYSSGAINSYSSYNEYLHYPLESSAGGICGQAGTDFDKADVSYCIALNSQISANGINSTILPSRIANFYIGMGSASNNFANTSIVVKKGSTKITSFSDIKSNGANLVGNAVDLLNAYLTTNPTKNGISLLKWKVDSGINNGYPMLQ